MRTHTTDPPHTVHITHTCARLLIQVLSKQNIHFSSEQDVMKWAPLLKLSEGRQESSLSPTHPQIDTHALALSHKHTLHLALTRSHILVRGAQLSPGPLLFERGACRWSDCRLKRRGQAGVDLILQPSHSLGRGRGKGERKQKRSSDGCDRHCRRWPGWDVAWRGWGCLLRGR